MENRPEQQHQELRADRRAEAEPKESVKVPQPNEDSAQYKAPPPTSKNLPPADQKPEPQAEPPVNAATLFSEGERAKPPRRYTIGRPRRFKTPEDLLEAAEQYITSCYDDKGNLIHNITITGMCNAIGTTRDALLRYENGELVGLQDGHGDDEGFRDAVKRIKHVCQEYAEDHGFNARNPAFAIFALKNYGWKDTQTIETSITETHTVDPATRELLEGYMQQLIASQKGQPIDVTPRSLPEPLKVDNPVDNTNHQQVSELSTD